MSSPYPDARKQRARTVHGGVHPVVKLIDLLAKGLGVEVQRGLVGRKEMVECRVEEADYFRAFVVDDRPRLLVPEYWYSEPAKSRRE